MMQAAANAHNVAHFIQLAIAPVFLLTAIAGMLAVLTNRLGRIIDRARVHEGRLRDAPPEEITEIAAKLAMQSRRAKLISRAIALCIATAILICTVIIVLFLGAFFQFGAAIPIALLFIAAMTTFVAGLLLFIREIYLATVNLRIGPR